MRTIRATSRTTLRNYIMHSEEFMEEFHEIYDMVCEALGTLGYEFLEHGDGLFARRFIGDTMTSCYHCYDLALEFFCDYNRDQEFPKYLHDDIKSYGEYLLTFSG